MSICFIHKYKPEIAVGEGSPLVPAQLYIVNGDRARAQAGPGVDTNMKGNPCATASGVIVGGEREVIYVDKAVCVGVIPIAGKVIRRGIQRTLKFVISIPPGTQVLPF